MKTVSALAVGFFALLGSARGEDKPSLDNDYLSRAHVFCNAMIQFAEVTRDRTENNQVKEFAETLIKDHKKGMEAIAKETKDRKIATVAGLEKETKEYLEKFRKLEGGDLDRQFLKVVIETHEKAISECKSQSEKGKDKECCEHAKEWIPVLQKHLDRAKEIQKNLK